MKYNLLCFAIGVLLGIFLGFVYCAAVLNKNEPPIPVPSAKELKTEVTQFEKHHAKSFDSLKTESENLSSALSITKLELGKAKQRSQYLQQQVYSLLDKRFAKQKADTIAAAMPCDTLVLAMGELMQANAHKDTLYEQVSTTLEAQVKNKDSTIALKDVQYDQLKSSFDKSIDSQQSLAAQNKLLNKQYKKQKVKSKLLSTLLFVLSGAAATYFLQH